LKINEVEALVGITKKNIRFYEEQGLLAPKRNADNGYRDYSETEVVLLRQIKLLRKLGIPIEEIRKMQVGIHTFSDGMRRHLVTLEREQQNLEQAVQLCQSLQAMDVSLAELDAEAVLSRMDTMERGGATFQNRQEHDTRVRYVAPVIITVLMVAFMVSIALLLVWAYVLSPKDAPPLWFLGIVVFILLAVSIGAVLALIQRIREIGKGEIEDAKRY